MSIDSNTEHEAFKRQTSSSHGFNGGHGNFSYFTSTPGSVVKLHHPDGNPVRPESQGPSPSPKSMPKLRHESPDKVEVSGGIGIHSAYASSPELKLASDSLVDTTSFSDESPSNMVSPVRRHMPSHIDDRDRRLSLSPTTTDDRSPYMMHQFRGQHNSEGSLTSARDVGPAMIAPAQLKDMIESVPCSEFILLDLRVFPQFSQSRIKGSLNLCIPTTLLKRPSFNVQKLHDTFTNDNEKARFAQWESSKYIIVYDAYTSERKDAVSAVNTLKKFSNEGWNGLGYILKGGFAQFAKIYPSLIDDRSSQELQSSKINLCLGTAMPRGAPVAGGCMMPTSKDAANPFFANIRQNQDLVDGVGQIGIKLPEDLGGEAPNILPKWLLEVVAPEDHGKKASEKFLRLELDEQSRMTKALTLGASFGIPTADCDDVQIAGIEKGGKNRYNNIWPFEHARVRLKGRPDGACDYVNASHIKPSLSNKRYIASQGPLPATFEVSNPGR